MKYRDKRLNYEHRILVSVISRMPIPVTSWSKASAATRLLGLGGSYPAGGMFVVCCQVGVSDTGRQFFLKSPTDCGVSEFDHGMSPKGRPRPKRAVET